MKNSHYLLKNVLLVAVGVVVALTATLVVFTSAIFSGNQQASNGQTEILKKKKEIISIATSKDVLSLEEKEKIGKEIIKGRAEIYDFSDEELKVIIGAINR